MDKRPICNCLAPTIHYGRQFPHKRDHRCYDMEAAERDHEQERRLDERDRVRDMNAASNGRK